MNRPQVFNTGPLPFFCVEKAGKHAVFHTGKSNAGQSADCPALLYYLHHIVEHQLCDLEIQDQAAGIHDGGDEGVAMMAGSAPSFLAASGSIPPTSFARMTLKNSETLTTMA